MFESGRSSGGFLSSLPMVTKNLLIINIGLWLLCSLMPSFGNTIYNTLGLHYWTASSFNPIQPVTYMFLQAPLSESIAHIFFNMFALYMFGRILENTWGSRRFFIFYMVCGVGAAVVQELAWMYEINKEFVEALAMQNHLSVSEMKEVIGANQQEADASFRLFANHFMTIGASGAVFGLLLGFACTYPNVPMYIFFIPVPIKAKYLVMGYAVIEIVLQLTGAMASVAHLAHLGGMLFAIPFIIYWHKKGTLHGWHR